MPRDQVPRVIASATAIGERPLPEGSSPLPSLASVGALSSDDAAGIAAALAFADQAALAHLPSLALAYAQILWQRLAAPAALDRIVEIALDYERHDSIPPLPAQDPRAMPRQTYFAMRVALAARHRDGRGHPRAGWQAPGGGEPVGSSRARDREGRARSTFRPAGGTSGDRSDRNDRAEPRDVAVRVARRVRGPDGGGSREHADLGRRFLGAFGNDMRVWAQAGFHDEARDELRRLASREIRYQPWDPDAWRALAVVADDATPIELELQQRSAAQLARALA